MGQPGYSPNMLPTVVYGHAFRIVNCQPCFIGALVPHPGRTVQLYGFEPWDTSLGLFLYPTTPWSSVIMFTAHSKMKRLLTLYIIYIIINLVHITLTYLI